MDYLPIHVAVFYFISAFILGALGGLITLYLAVPDNQPIGWRRLIGVMGNNGLVSLIVMLFGWHSLGSSYPFLLLAVALATGIAGEAGKEKVLGLIRDSILRGARDRELDND